MRWSCPHCGVNLAVSDDKLGNGWSFSRCYKCGGFALIRRAEVNLVKVDRAPAGEHIILPEATEEPAQMMGQEATENLARYRKESAEKNALRQASRVLQQQQDSARASAEAAQTLASSIQSGSAPSRSTPPAFRPNASEIPLPLSPLNLLGSQPSARARARVLPVAIAIAAVTAVGSGLYLFEQGQTLWEKARITASNEEAPSIRQASARKTRSNPRSEGNGITDQVHQNAMAPLRNSEEEPGTLPGSSRPDAISETLAKTAALNSSGKPSAAPAPLLSANSALIVRLKGPTGKLYAGPGSLYPVVGNAEPSRRYTVTDWNDRWFRVIVEDAPGKAPITAWIRTDLVHVVPASGGESLPAYP